MDPPMQQQQRPIKSVVMKSSVVYLMELAGQVVEFFHSQDRSPVNIGASITVLVLVWKNFKTIPSPQQIPLVTN